MKEINMVIEFEAEIKIMKLKQMRFKAYMIFHLQDKIVFDKLQIGLSFREDILDCRCIPVGESENVYLLTHGENIARILTINDKFKPDKTSYQQLRLSVTMRNQVEDGTLSTLGELPDPMEDNEPDIELCIKSFFVRRQNIYLEDLSGHLKILTTTYARQPKPFKKCIKTSKEAMRASLSEIQMHLNFFSDLLVASTAIVLAHGKIISIFDFKTGIWSHIIPDLPVYQI